MLCWIFLGVLVFSVFRYMQLFMAIFPIGIHCALWCLSGGCAARSLLSGPLKIYFNCAGRLKVVASALSYILLLRVFNCKNVSTFLLIKCIFFCTLCYLQCCIIHSKCTIFMYLTNHVSCMSVWGGFGHGMADLVVIGGVGLTWGNRKSLIRVTDMESS